MIDEVQVGFLRQFIDGEIQIAYEESTQTNDNEDAAYLQGKVSNLWLMRSLLDAAERDSVHE